MSGISEDIFGDITPEELQEAMRSDVIGTMIDSSADLAARYYHRLVTVHDVPPTNAAVITASFVEGGMGTN